MKHRVRSLVGIENNKAREYLPMAHLKSLKKYEATNLNSISENKHYKLEREIGEKNNFTKIIKKKMK